MNHTDDDLTALGSFRAELAEPGEARLSAVRARVEAASRPVSSTAGWPRRRLLAPRGWTLANGPRRRALAPTLVAAAATLVVVAGAATVGLVNASGGGTVQQTSGGGAGQDPASKAAAAQDPVGKDLAGPRPAGQDAGQPVTKTPSTPAELAPGAHQAAVDLLRRLADQAGTGPAPITVPAGRLLYVRGAGAAEGGAGLAVHEMWLDPEGSIPLMIRRTEGGEVTLLSPDPGNPKDNLTAEAARARSDLAAHGPSLRLPTPAYLAGLPTDPVVLLAQLSAAGGAGGAWSADHAVADLLAQTMYQVEPLVTPQVRAAVYRALALVPSIASSGQVTEVEGRQVYVVSQSEGGIETQLLLDANTGRVVGDRIVEVGGTAVKTTVWSYAVVDAVGATA